MLAAIERKQGGSKDRGKLPKPGSLTELLKRLTLDKNRAQEAQRIGCLPKIELIRGCLASASIFWRWRLRRWPQALPRSVRGIPHR
jgi:hypothetical protein